MKMVFKTRVISRNFVSDFGASLKNIIGGRLKTYEKMLNTAIEEVQGDLLKEHPQATNIKMQITEFQNASIAVVVYGEINE